MLLQFSFQNFRSFRENAVLDLTAMKGNEFKEHIFPIGGEKVLPLAAIYGANASGKSNIYNAFTYMTQYVIHSFNYGDEDMSDYIPTPFLLDMASRNEVSQFEVYFILPTDSTEKTYQYGFTLGKDGIVEEWLGRKAKTSKTIKPIFYRNTETGEIDLDGFKDSIKKNIKVSLEPQTLIISLGAKLKVDICKLVRDWFLDNRLSNFANPIESLMKYRYLPENFTNDQTVQSHIVRYLNTFDMGIDGFAIEKMEGDDDKDSYFKISTLRNIIGSDEKQAIPLYEESAGTQKMFALYQDLQDTLNRGSVLFVDELNARLHPLLLRHILQQFLDTDINTKGAQLIYTTHDLVHMNNDFLRRDEIWFVEKDEQGVSELYSMGDFKNESGDTVRKDLNYMKNYLYGRYGGIPRIHAMHLNRER